ncbi:L,D-transpeptidase [Salinarimonas soli]|uniref:L,D-transpeptidase family protein n=1 Tax=Salinarimonas soli TaxID=1638099 RepID=A0A5B2W1G7_9HYPH|nr:L,D-transpeptidase [Salinarimonas soli]KAA2244307.1 L,D-transpeptidase family protein [Salinarimonas soli]
MSRLLTTGLVLAGIAAAGDARSQALANEPPAPIEQALEPAATGTLRRPAPAPAPQSSGLGGGFLELLLTGRDPTTGARALRPEPMVPTALVPPMPRPLEASPPRERIMRTPQIANVPADQGVHRAVREVEPRFRRQVVDYDGPHAPGTIVVDTPNRFLYLVQADGRALRYGIGVGRPGFSWAGLKSVSMKREWPDWRPPEQMLKRRPDLPRYMAGGRDNPLGARALYLGSSLYRIHGTNEPWSIGQAVSSGCIRMTNEDVIDLYDRVRVGARVFVI